MKGFEITLKVLQTEQGLYRAAYELAEDAAKENIEYMEVRFSPILHTEHKLSETAILEAETETLAQIGFDVEPFGGTTYRLRTIPEILLKADPATALADILSELAEGAVPLSRQSDERLIVTVCKRAAVKAGQTLSMQEMQDLIHNLERCSAPRTCPHGRPTMVHLSAAQLAREFGRV